MKIKRTSDACELISNPICALPPSSASFQMLFITFETAANAKKGMVINMEINNEYVFSNEYNEKKASILRSLKKNEKSGRKVMSAKPVKVVLAFALMCVILTTTLLATGVHPMPKYIFHTDYLPDGVDKIVSAEERLEHYSDLTAPPLEYYIVKLNGAEFTRIDEMPASDVIEYEIFEVNGRYAQIILYKNWTGPEGVEEYTNKQLIVYFEEEDLIVQIWGSNRMSIDDMKKTAEGLWFEPTEDGSLAVKLYECD